MMGLGIDASVQKFFEIKLTYSEGSFALMAADEKEIKTEIFSFIRACGYRLEEMNEQISETICEIFSDANTAVCMSDQAGLRIDASAIVMNEAIERKTSSGPCIWFTPTLVADLAVAVINVPESVALSQQPQSLHQHHLNVAFRI
jgi:hypothetical protein